MQPLFAIAISAFVWSRQGKLAIAVMVSMAFGMIFYCFIIVTSLEYQQCPFQTPMSTIIRVLYERIYMNVKTWHGEASPEPGEAKEALSEVPSMKWIFKSSTDPEVISSVARMVPCVQWTSELQLELQPELHIRTICLRLLSTFKTCFNAGAWSSSTRRRALACGRALHHLFYEANIQKYITPNVKHFDGAPLEMWSYWQDLNLPWGLEKCKASFDQYATTPYQYHEDEARNALRLAIMTGCPGFLQPTDPALIWDGVFDWEDDSRTKEDFDWLVDFLVHFQKFTTRNFDAMGDALLALSAMQGLGSVSRRDKYLDAVIFAMEAGKPSRLRHAALRAVFDARFELVEIVDQEKGDSSFRERLLKELAPALFITTKPIAPQLSGSDDPDAVFNPKRDDFYLRLILILAKQRDWRAHLVQAGHIERCASLLSHVIEDSMSYVISDTSHSYHLAGISIQMLGQANPAGTAGTALNSEPTNKEGSRLTTNVATTLPAAPETPTLPGLLDRISEKEWWDLMKGAWKAMRYNNLHLMPEAVEVLPGIVTYTIGLLQTPTALYDTRSLVRVVDRIYEVLDDGQVKLEVKRLRDAL
ncbi:uncharacterized protein EDB93DRAFT_656431 [Suillus bovinus]|uniref:uncharacterized protein n=1 Tax=Suillus bovinus TaxID=48563 RepID=UPI001B86FEF3|nr:uncharacterized protein EDB93DRAFT_656431 [Suillus bovinus]KAG2158267.1 hypothetical protein EDB93DRAFT_656431 [Suillus bovinus]